MKTPLQIILAVLFSIILSPIFAQNTPPTTPQEKRAAFLTPDYYSNWIGASFLTIPTIEKEFEVTPVRVLNSTYFYDFGTCFVGMEANEQGVVVQLTLRLYSDAANDFIQKAVDNGFKYVSNGEDVNIRTNTGQLVPELYGASLKRYQKVTQNGKVILEISNSPKYASEYAIAIYRTK